MAWQTFRICYIFFSARWLGGVRAGGRGSVLIEIRGRAGWHRRRWSGRTGAARVSAGGGGGQLNIFFGGRNSHQVGFDGRHFQVWREACWALLRASSKPSRPIFPEPHCRVVHAPNLNSKSMGREFQSSGKDLVAPDCAIPRDYLSDTPLLRAMGFLVSQHGQLGAIPPPPFLSVSPLESMRSGGAMPPPQKGYLSDTCAIPYKNKANGCDTPLCDTISKGYCAIWGGISRWAAKGKDIFSHPCVSIWLPAYPLFRKHYLRFLCPRSLFFFSFRLYGKIQ